MLESQLRTQLASVGERLGRLWFWRRLTWCWMGGVALAIAWSWLISAGDISFGWIPAAAVLVAVYVWVSSKSLPLARIEIARRVEQAFPDLNSRLLAALEQNPDMKSGRWNVLQRQLISEAVHHSRINDWSDAIPTKQLRRAFFRQAVALTGFVVVCCSVWPAAAARSAAAKSHAAIASTGDFEQPVIEPGDVELERNSSLLVLARFSRQSPASVTLVWKAEQGPDNPLALNKSLDDPIFAGRLNSVDRDIEYRVEFDGRKSREYKVTVYDLPALVRPDLELRYPSYTQLETKRLEDAFVATVVEGTTIHIACRLNKAVAEAKLVESDGKSLTLHPDAENPQIYTADFVPTRLHRLKLQLTDEAGRHNRDPEEFRFEAKPNQPPQIAFTFPSRDTKVSPLEEMRLEATVMDDFKLIETGVVISIPGRDPLTLKLGQDLAGGQLHKLATMQRLEELKVEPDELVTYYAYADDYGPDGAPRRTSSDLYFAEVRSFEEIFRQIDAQQAGQAQSSSSQQQEQNGNPMDKLVDLQKQIIAATWKLARSPGSKFDAKKTDSVTVIQNSQKKAIEQLEGVKERVTAPQLQPVLTMIGERMEAADASLSQSISESSAQPLTKATSAEQAAYQGLLKLRAKEHLMMKSQQNSSSGSSGASASASREQMEQLELNNKQNRYETQRSGQKQADAAQQREELAVLDRLKDLARRQQGVNDKLKELEAALRTTKDEAEKEELERQLKRLRDDQQQLLHDADEVRNRMTQSAQQEKMNEARQQLEQTRQRLVDTAEKLREGQLSQALNSGTRAERELQQLQEDFRKQTAAQFQDAMRTMREEARQLAEREKQLGQQLTSMQDESKHSLRQSKNRQNLETEFKEQRRQASDLVEEAKSIVEQAEQAEPLLSKQLYDTVRSARESKTDQALDATSQLLRAGFLPEAQRAETQAREGIEKLKQGIEKAAEAVLGDEVESMKRAKAELAELSNSLEREIAAQQRRQGQGQGQQSEGQQGQQNQGQSGQQGSQARQQGQGQGQQSAGQQNQQGQGQGQQGQGQQGQRGQQQGQGQDQGEGQKDQQNGQQGQGQAQQGQGQQGQGQQGQGQQGRGQQQGQQGQRGQGQQQGQGQGQGQQGQQGQDQQGQGQGSGQQGQGGKGGQGQGQGQEGQQGQGTPADGNGGGNGGGNGSQQGRSSPRAGLRNRGPQAPQPSRGTPNEGSDEGGWGGGPGGQGGPLTGGNFSDWNERLRDVESMVSDPKLQAEVAKVRERARSLRADFKRHSQTPNWELVRTSVHEPMIELQRQLAEEIARRETPDSLVPVDRDPVPTQYQDLVRTYYERLGSGKPVNQPQEKSN